MISIGTRPRVERLGILGLSCGFMLVLIAATARSAGEPASSREPLTNVLSRDAAVRWALENNPELAAIRQQHGIAAAAVIIARTYPFNPLWEVKLRAASGPESAGISNRLSNEHKLLIDVEVRGQGRHRRQGADAALSRTDWEIAFQEEMLAIRVLRAFDAVLYRQGKLQLTEQTIRLNEQTVKQVNDLRSANKLSAADLILARTEVEDARAQLGTGRTAIVSARNDLRRALGVTDVQFELEGSLDVPSKQWDVGELIQIALEHRADLHARQSALSEAEARLRLETANRYGNPNVGPAYEYDPTRVNLIGVQFALPLPVFNTHHGDIELRRAELARAGLELRQTEVVIHQEIRAALDRLHDAQAWADTYRTEVLPNLQNGLKEIETLLSQAAVDVLRVIDVRRKLLKARDGHLDAVYEVRQAQADLAAAVGDPALAVVH